MHRQKFPSEQVKNIIERHLPDKLRQEKELQFLHISADITM
jgi:hypothetical protein